MTGPGVPLGHPARLRALWWPACAASALVAAWLLAVVPVAGMAACVLLALAAWGESRRLAAGRSIADLRHDAGGLCASRAGVPMETGRTVILPFAVLARFTGAAGRPVDVVVTPSSAGPDAFRRLVVRLGELVGREASSRRAAAPRR